MQRFSPVITFDMKFHIVAVGNKLPNWVNIAFGEYSKRMPHDMVAQLVEVKPEKRTGAKNKAQILDAECQRIKTSIPAGCRIIVLDERGVQWTTRQLANRLEKWLQEGQDTAFVIGGADGLHESIKSSAHIQLALSKLTFPHAMARVVLAEQLYRAVSLIKNHPYHRI